MKNIIIILIFALLSSCGLYYVAKPQVKTIRSAPEELLINTLVRTKSDSIIYLNTNRKDKKIYTGFALIPTSQNAPDSFKSIKRIPKNSSFVITEYIREFDGQHVWYYVKFESTENHLKQYQFVRMIGRSQHEVTSSLDDFTW